MANQSAARAPRAPRASTLARLVRYEATFQDSTPAPPPGDAGPRLGPYETTYLVDMGYAAPVRSD